ncbi:MAG: GspMb/PilO family protein [Caulobacteraceae bacterium]|nr:GspMb/PilO family protein [Caulobacteraceae bacterium]
MSARARFGVHAVITAFTVAAAVTVLLVLVLSMIAHPGGLNVRLTGVDTRLAEAERLTASASGPLDYPAGTVCHQASGLATSALQQRLQAAARAGGVTLAKLDVVPGVGDEAQRALTPVTFSLEASGAYDAVVRMVAGLAWSEPRIFVDQADLKSQTATVALKLSGRLYCSTVVHP